MEAQNEKATLACQIEIIKKLREHARYNKIEYFDPYPFQKQFLDINILIVFKLSSTV